MLSVAPANPFVGMAGNTSHRPSLQNRFVGAAVVPAAPIIPICRGGSVYNRPYSIFFRQKNFEFTIQIRLEYIYIYVCIYIYAHI